MTSFIGAVSGIEVCCCRPTSFATMHGLQFLVSIVVLRLHAVFLARCAWLRRCIF